MNAAAKHNAPELSFSWHARQRLEQRRLDLSSEELERVEQAVRTLSRKGGRLALVLLDRLALLVSITNRRVITIAAQEQLEQSVFTNIDSAAVA